MAIEGLKFAAVAGFYAALAGVTGKLASSESDSRRLCLNCVDHFRLWLPHLVSVHILVEHLYLVRALFFVLTLLLTSVMWVWFSRALSHMSTSLAATVAATTSNMMATAFLSQWLFGERIGVLWWCGFVLVVGGLCLILRASDCTIHGSTSPNKTE